MARRGKNETVKSEMARINLYAVVCYMIVVCIITAAYALETFGKNARSIPYFIITLLLAMVPALVSVFVYKKNNEAKYIKHIVLYGYLAFYGFLLFTATTPLTFTYIVLMIVISSIYNDKKYAIQLSVIAVVMNVIQVIVAANTGSAAYINMAGAEIQIILLIMLGIFSVSQSSILAKNNVDKLELIKEQQVKSEELYSNTIETVGVMTQNINQIYEKLEELIKSSEATRSAMKGVSNGSNETSKAVQNQMVQTEQVQKYLDMVDASTNELTNEMNAAKHEIELGRENMNKMVDSVSTTVSGGDEVTAELGELDKKINEMNSIIEIITNITEQTSLVALNASIEAARAGEAGRGFAVVASEISSMAEQTTQATEHITNLVHNVSQAIENVVRQVRNMIENVNVEKNITDSTKTSFTQMANSTTAMDDNIVELAEILRGLTRANKKIIDSIQTISEVSEEVTAHASETYKAEEENSEKIQEVWNLMTELKELTAKLSEE